MIEADLPRVPVRQYRLPRAALGLRVMYATLGAFSVILIIGDQHEHGSVPILLPLVCTLGLLAVAIWHRRVAAHVGLDECETGFVDHHLLGRRVLKLEYIDHFAHRRRRSVDQVVAVLRDDRAIPIVGLQEGQRVVWRGGETRNIVDVLNRRLRDRRELLDPGEQPATAFVRQVKMASVDVINSEALVDCFGGWPSFHDAEVYGLRLDSGQRTNGLVSLQLDVHVFAVDGQRSTGRLNFVNHTLVTFGFEEVEALALEGFGQQNVLDDLVLEPVHLAAGRQVQVTLVSNNGLDGSFRCRFVMVLDAVPLEPGKHSVYGR